MQAFLLALQYLLFLKSYSISVQRICDDVPAFTEGSTNLMFGITRKLFGVLAFSGRFPSPQILQILTSKFLFPFLHLQFQHTVLL